ncbi:MAG: hypothetical protein ABEJ56_03230 [Candidatus Nanohaloarchaea archaeon]
MTASDNNVLSIMNSELAVQILAQIVSEGNRDYGANIADELDKSQASICRTLTDLNEAGFVSKCKNSRVHYYSVDFDEVSRFWFDSLANSLDEMEEAKFLLKNLERNEEEARKVLVNFLIEILKDREKLEGHNFNQLVYDNFACSVLHLLKDDKYLLLKRHGIFHAVLATAFVRHEHGFPEEMRKALKK